MSTVTAARLFKKQVQARYTLVSSVRTEGGSVEWIVLSHPQHAPPPELLGRGTSPITAWRLAWAGIVERRRWN